MQYATFDEIQVMFPMGRFKVNSCQLSNILNHDKCRGVMVRVLHLGTFNLDRSDMLSRLRLDNIKITCLDGEVIIDEPSYGIAI